MVQNLDKKGRQEILGFRAEDLVCKMTLAQLDDLDQQLHRKALLNLMKRQPLNVEKEVETFAHKNGID